MEVKAFATENLPEIWEKTGFELFRRQRLTGNDQNWLFIGTSG